MLCALLAARAAVAQNYFDVMPVTCSVQRGGASYRASIDYPVGGPDAVVRSARAWIGQMLECDASMPDTPVGGMDADDFGRLLDTVARDYTNAASAGTATRRVELTWMYEDPTCVTYEAVITDRDSVAWTTSDVACFAKSDGHRVAPGEIFSCDERQIKRLMWQYRGSLPMEVARPDDLYVGNCGFIDGWVLVVGPARGTSGAVYRLRYPEVEQWLVKSGGEGYLAK